jgi:uncharacterized protein (DUF1501 family)
MLMKRRDLLKAAALLPATLIAGRLSAVPATTTKLLVVFLRGAYDAANVVIPVSSNFYYQSRPMLAIAKPGGDANAALALNSDWGLHPALKDSLYPLFQKKQIAFIPFAGTDDTSRSHFETQDTVEMGQPLAGPRNYDSGFMGRLVSVLTAPQPASFTAHLPLTFRGGALVPNFAPNVADKPGLDPRDQELIRSMYGSDELAPAIDKGFQVQAEVYQTVSREMQAANRGAVSTKGFALAAERIGILMHDKFNVGFLDVGGWDTHVNQGGATGYLPQRLTELGQGLTSFADHMGSAWNDTIVVVVSEFGRTFRENGDHGTDHGHGSVYWVLGGKINGGRFLGDQIAVTQASLFQDRDYPVLNEYRGALAALFQQIYGLSPTQIQKVFPQAVPKNIAFV